MSTPLTRLRAAHTPLPLREPADVLLIERLLTTAAGDQDLDTIVRVINRGRADLAGSPQGAIPELLERLVRQRLR